MIFDIARAEKCFEFGWALVVEPLVFGFASSKCEGVMDAEHGLYHFVSFLGAQGSHKDVVAVMVISNQQIVVACA